jgi:hypothetical protein
VLGGRQPERHGGEEGRRRHLALPVERSAVADIGDAVADRAQHLEGRHHFARRIDGDVDASARQRADALGDALGRQARPGQPLRPGRDHAPFDRLRPRNGGRGQRAGDANARSRYEFSSRGHGSLHCA